MLRGPLLKKSISFSVFDEVRKNILRQKYQTEAAICSVMIVKVAADSFKKGLNFMQIQTFFVTKESYTFC